MAPKTLMRQPWAILGAIGFMSLIQDAIEWQSHLGVWLEAWRTIIRPFGYYLCLGWLIEFFGYNVPDWWSDYFAMGALCLAGFFRLVTATSHSFVQGVRDFVTIYRDSVIVTLMAWPVLITVMVVLYAIGRFVLTDEKEKAVSSGIAYIKGFAVSGDFDPRMIEDRVQIFVESFLWAVVFIALNYGVKSFIP